MGNHDSAFIRLIFSSKVSITAVALAVTCAVLFVKLVKHGYSGSVDMAHHYALIHWLFRHWTVQPGAAGILGEMAIYPRYSHIVAAVLARFSGSPFLAMQVTASAALVAIWASLALLPRQVAKSLSWPLTLSLMLVLALNHYAFGLEIFGHELVGNYFYSQLAGQACFMLTLVFATHLEVRRGFSGWVPIATIIICIASAGVHLLPAIEGVAYGLLLLVIHALSERRSMAGRVIATAFVSLLAAIALYEHPAFAAMRGISENNGGLALTLLDTLPRLCILAVATALVSLYLAITSIPTIRGYHEASAVVGRHFGSAGLAIVAVFLLQVVALKLGYGSEYACRKYGFGLATFFMVNLAILLANVWITQRSAKHIGGTTVIAGWVQPAALLIAFWYFTFAGSTVLVDTSSFLTMEAAASTAKQIGAVEDTKPAYARGLSVGRIGDVANYLVTVGIFESPRDQNAYATLANNEFPKPDRVGAIFTSTATSSIWSNSNCIRRPITDGYAVADGSCVMRKFSNNCQASIDFSSAGYIPTNSLKGFSQAESDGRWTDGQTASFSCIYALGARPRQANLFFIPFTPHNHAQTLDVRINDTPVAHVHVNEAGVLSLNIPSIDDSSNQILRIDLALPDAISPTDVGMKSDPRKLGLKVTRLQLE
ncbi:MAG TPA: hypothetical protein VIM98_04480 [Dyella sp.]|uniref:hypothetical protein n=1 Tax=Dyella sp. TaxID=1869338 RepID=UPI002F94E294